MTDLPPDLKALKSTTHALIDAVGGTTAAQILCGHRSPSTVSAAASISFPDRFLAVDDLMVLEKRAQQPIVSAWLVARHKADRAPVRRNLSIEDVARLAKEGSESKLAIVHAHARRSADGSFSAADRAVISRELRDLSALVAELLEVVEEGS
ncbi:hypothetical protein [Aureimonas sp. SK2]|uniref:hypothetical protein n=1 Tax=Aureimonas sp. SK2 TaxID=3015992 RepID=UPI002444F6E9|nr:hypothetical protein [Aureimonas sp. SK2]